MTSSPSPSPPPKICILGGPPGWALQTFGLALLVAIYAGIALALCVLFPHEGIIPVWKSLLSVSGMIAIPATILVFLFGIYQIFESWWKGVEMVLDEQGVHYHLLFGRVRSSPWSEVKVKLVDRFEAVKQSSGLEVIRIFGVAGKLLDAAMSDYSTITIKGVEFESPLFKIRFEPGNYDFVGLERWLLCRGLGADIALAGGSVTWDRDGFESVNLAGCAITDEQFIFMASLLKRVPELERLDLTGTRLSSAIVPALQALPNLCFLEIEGTGLTPDVLPLVLKEPPLRGPSGDRKPTFDFLK